MYTPHKTIPYLLLSAECRLRHEATRGGREVWSRVGGARKSDTSLTCGYLFSRLPLTHKAPNAPTHSP